MDDSEIPSLGGAGGGSKEVTTSVHTESNFIPTMVFPFFFVPTARAGRTRVGGGGGGEKDGNLRRCWISESYINKSRQLISSHSLLIESGSLGGGAARKGGRDLSEGVKRTPSPSKRFADRAGAPSKVNWIHAAHLPVIFSFLLA